MEVEKMVSIIIQIQMNIVSFRIFWNLPNVKKNDVVFEAIPVSWVKIILMANANIRIIFTEERGDHKSTHKGETLRNYFVFQAHS